MISYEINEETKQIKCIISGDELEKNALKLFSNKLNNISNNSLIISPEKLLLKKEYVGIAKYNQDETNDFSIETGKIIARKKAFEKYNKDMYNKIRMLKENVVSFNEELLMSCFEYEVVVKDIIRAIKQY